MDYFTACEVAYKNGYTTGLQGFFTANSKGYVIEYNKIEGKIIAQIRQVEIKSITITKDNISILADNYCTYDIKDFYPTEEAAKSRREHENH